MASQRSRRMLCTTARIADEASDVVLYWHAATGPRFGGSAISWDHCDAEHLLRAWAEQAATSRGPVDLYRIGVDPRAVSALPRELAAHFGAVPLRLLPDMLIVAVGNEAAIQPLCDFLGHLRPSIRFVMAEPRTVTELLAVHYDTDCCAAA